MIDKRGKIGKMLDHTKVIYHCLRCSREFIGDSDTNLHYCPRCNANSNDVILVINSSLVVRK